MNDAIAAFFPLATGGHLQGSDGMRLRIGSRTHHWCGAALALLFDARLTYTRNSTPASTRASLAVLSSSLWE